MTEGDGMYQYWILRYVPDVVRGEFRNVGIVVARGDDWAVRTIERISGSRQHIRHVHAALEEIGERLRPASDRAGQIELASGHARGALGRGDWLRWFTDHSRNTIQAAGPQPVEAESAREGLDFLFPLLVDSSRAERAMGRGMAISALRDAFVRSDLPPRSYRGKVRLMTNKQRASFDFEVGQNDVRQLTKAWAFDRRDPGSLIDDIQSWSFALGVLRDEGGFTTPTQGGREREVNGDTPIRVLYVPPERPNQRGAFEAAQEAWDRLGVQAYPLGEEQRITAEAEHLLMAA